jgi:hypothetical protein
MTTHNTISIAASASLAVLLLAGCSGSAAGPSSAELVPRATSRGLAAPALPRASSTARHGVRPDTCAGNALYFSDYQSSVIDSFDASGGSGACTVTVNGIANPIGIWVQPVSGPYHNDLFVANSGNGTAVAFKTPINNMSKPLWQFNTGGEPSDVVQDMSGNVYVAVYGTPTIDVFRPPFAACAFPTGCGPSYAISDACGAVFWLATDGKGDVYSNNYCGYVSLFIAPIGAGTTGTVLSGATYAQPGGMIVDRNNGLVINDPGSNKITSYRLNVLGASASPAFTLAPYAGVIWGIGLDQTDKFLWGANSSALAGQEYRYTSGGTGPRASATDSGTLAFPMGAAARPSSPE